MTAPKTIPLRSSDRKYATVTETAEALGVSVPTIRRLIATDRLPVPYVRVGAQIRVSRPALDRLLDPTPTA